jgi:hypothetical protein
MVEEWFLQVEKTRFHEMEQMVVHGVAHEEKVHKTAHEEMAHETAHEEMVCKMVDWEMVHWMELEEMPMVCDCSCKTEQQRVHKKACDYGPKMSPS